MGKPIKILLIGLGSIGRRHLSCLQKMENIQVTALRTSKGTLKESAGIKEFYSIKDAIKYEPHGVIISNPTSLHVETALPFLINGCKVLIEKPIGYNSVDAQRLEPYKENLRVAYCFRFLPMATYFKELFKEEPPFKISFKRSFYLPKWHPYADYREEYMAKKELGGGVIRTLSHEIDLALFWIGKPKEVTGITDKISFLELDTDDFAFFTLKAENGCRINYELDFFSPSNINSGEVLTEKGKYYWNNSKLYFYTYEHSSSSELVSIETNYIKMYQDQIEDFIKFVNGGESSNATYTDSVEVLKIIEKIDVSE